MKFCYFTWHFPVENELFEAKFGVPLFIKERLKSKIKQSMPSICPNLNN